MKTQTENASDQADGTPDRTIDLMACLQKSLSTDVIAKRLAGGKREAYGIVIYNGPEALIIEDVGPWEEHQTITNDIGRRFFYYDSSEQLDEILVVHGRFIGFKTGCDLRTDLVEEIGRRRQQRQKSSAVPPVERAADRINDLEAALADVAVALGFERAGEWHPSDLVKAAAARQQPRAQEEGETPALQIRNALQILKISGSSTFYGTHRQTTFMQEALDGIEHRLQRALAQLEAK